MPFIIYTAIAVTVLLVLFAVASSFSNPPKGY